jgi:hypothetical protein
MSNHLPPARQDLGKTPACLTPPFGSSDPPPVVVMMPADVQQELHAVLDASILRLAWLRDVVDAAVPDPGSFVPTDPLVGITDVATALSNTVQRATDKTSPIQMGTVAKGIWSQEYVDSLPDSCFLYVIETLQHDSDYRTLPLGNRKFPYKDHTGRISLEQITFAIQGIHASGEMWLSEQKKRSLLVVLAGRWLLSLSDVVMLDELPPDVSQALAAIDSLVTSVGAVDGPTQPALSVGAAMTMGANAGETHKALESGVGQPERIPSNDDDKLDYAEHARNFRAKEEAKAAAMKVAKREREHHRALYGEDASAPSTAKQAPTSTPALPYKEPDDYAENARKWREDREAEAAGLKKGSK